MLPRDVEQKIIYHLNQIESLFTAPQITLLVRAPLLPDGDLVMTTDTLEGAIGALQKAKARNLVV
jgi:hypothetical protein